MVDTQLTATSAKATVTRHTSTAHTRAGRQRGSFNAVDLCFPPWNSGDHAPHVHSEAERTPASVRMCQTQSAARPKQKSIHCPQAQAPDPATVGPAGTPRNPILYFNSSWNRHAFTQPENPSNWESVYYLTFNNGAIFCLV